MKNEVQDLSNEWKKELQEIKEHPVLKNHIELFEKMIGTLHASDVIIEKLSSKKRRVKHYDTLQMICNYYFSHSYTMALAILSLAKQGFAVSALGLSRTLIESVINLAYLYYSKEINGNEEEREAWIEHSAISLNKIGTAWEEMQNFRKNNSLPIVEPVELFDKEKMREMDDRSKAFKIKYKRSNWAVVEKIEQRARKIDSLNKLGTVLESVYHLMYRRNSEIIHGMSASAMHYIKNDGKYTAIRFGPSGQNINEVLAITTQMMVVIVYLANSIFHTNLDIENQLAKSGYE